MMHGFATCVGTLHTGAAPNSSLAVRTLMVVVVHSGPTPHSYK